MNLMELEKDLPPVISRNQIDKLLGELSAAEPSLTLIHGAKDRKGVLYRAKGGLPYQSPSSVAHGSDETCPGGQQLSAGGGRSPV
jgi:hypothetical protein